MRGRGARLQRVPGRQRALERVRRCSRGLVPAVGGASGLGPECPIACLGHSMDVDRQRRRSRGPTPAVGGASGLSPGRSTGMYPGHLIECRGLLQAEPSVPGKPDSIHVCDIC